MAHDGPHLVEINAPLPEEAGRFRTLEEPEAADRLEASSLGSAQLVFAVSPPLAAYATARGARRVEVLQNAADITRFKKDNNLALGSAYVEEKSYQDYSAGTPG